MFKHNLYKLILGILGIALAIAALSALLVDASAQVIQNVIFVMADDLHAIPCCQPRYMPA